MTARRAVKGPGKRDRAATRSGSGRGLRVAIAASRFNERITDQLVTAALATLAASGVERRAVRVVRVPGAFELPLAAQWLCRDGRYDAIVCLGAIIRGDTPHFELIARAVSQGIMDVGLREGRPVVFGVLTTETVEQAEQRADPAGFNRGAEAARTAIDMAVHARQFARKE
jgi:6,7-dimethyl-8-ribityllumazine synthase